MKTLLITLLTITSAFSQRNVEICKWEITTQNGGLIVGAAKDDYAAVLMIESFKTRNKYSAYKYVSHRIQYGTVPIKKRSDDPLTELFENTENGKKYFVLSSLSVEAFNKYKWHGHPGLTFEICDIEGISFGEAKERVNAILRYKIKVNNNVVNK